MRYRRLDAAGDYALGNGVFLVDSPDAVAQAIKTRLALYTGEWFIDTADGTPWRTDVLGKYTLDAYDAVLKDRILGTPGVLSIDAYTSSLDRNTRALAISVTVSTVYGSTSVNTTA